LQDRSLARALLTSVVLATAGVLAGCNSDELSLARNARANKPIPEKLISEMQSKNMDPQSPMLVRLFKQEAELEVWKQTRDGQFALLKTYPICRWSGDLGPKVREGDRQAPEGFYSITPAQMNPQSSYFLSFNIGYPNAFDRALGRSGSQLMVHGDCSSRGCYAMTDEQISEIYSLGRESFFGGQRAFQVQAYPFKMTPTNMARHRNNPNMPFWKMIKEGYDHFQVTRQEPKVEVCEAKYVFNPAPPPGASKSPVFNASAKCPAYVVPEDIAQAVRQKQHEDEVKTAELIAKGTPVAQRRPDIDGGMHKVFASKIPDASTGLSDPDGSSVEVSSFGRAPGTIPPHVNPPKAVASLVAAPPVNDEPTAAASVLQAPRAAYPAGAESSLFNSLARKPGNGSDTTASTPSPKPKPPVAHPAVAKPAEAPRSIVATTKPAAATGAAAALKPADTPHVASVRQAPKPAASGAAATGNGALAGAAPVVSGSFESRFSAMR
jgi:murein L,D-transpeptidase YafK